MPNYMIDDNRRKLPVQGSLPRVINKTTGRVHLGYYTPVCAPLNSSLSYEGTFRAVTCPECLLKHPEAAWPTPQRETLEDGSKWAVLDFGFCFVAVGKFPDGSWRGNVTPAWGYEGSILPVHCGGKSGKESFRKLFMRVVHYINNGYSWKSATTFNQIGG